MMLYSRKRVRYRRDGYCWKKRKDGKTTREDHMKLKVQGTECIYGCYVHSAILPTFHRRCYWLLQVSAASRILNGTCVTRHSLRKNPDIVLVHYLNVPYTDDNKVISPALNYFADSKKEWTKEELISELKPMCKSHALRLRGRPLTAICLFAQSSAKASPTSTTSWSFRPRRRSRRSCSSSWRSKEQK